MANRDKRNRDFGSNRESFRDFSDEKPRKKDKHWKKFNKEQRKKEKEEQKPPERGQSKGFDCGN